MAVVGLCAVAALAASEFVTWRAARQALPTEPAPHDPRRNRDIVVVLGFRPNARARSYSGGDPHPNVIQRWRTRIGVRSADPGSYLLFTGGTVRGERSEAATMASHASESLGFPSDRILLEEEARTTWENIARSLPYLQDAARIRIASNTLHARRARQYLRKQDPDTARYLQRGRDFVWGEHLLLKLGVVVYEAVRHMRDASA